MDEATPMEVDTEEAGASGEKKKAQEKEDYTEVMQDADFLQSVLDNLPGVDPNSEAIKDAMKALTTNTPAKDGKDGKDSKKEDKK